MHRASPAASRLRASMIAAGVQSIRELARRAEIPHQTLHRILKSDVGIVGAEVLMRLSRSLRVDPEWLLSGEGSATPPMRVTPDEAVLLERYRALPEEQRECMVLAMPKFGRKRS